MKKVPLLLQILDGMRENVFLCTITLYEWPWTKIIRKCIFTQCGDHCDHEATIPVSESLSNNLPPIDIDA